MNNLGLFWKSMLEKFGSVHVDSTVLPLPSRLITFLFNYVRTFCVRKYISYLGEHITDTSITETDTTELENLIHNIIDIFIIETYHN
jgi:hypothetical protein